MKRKNSKRYTKIFKKVLGWAAICGLISATVIVADAAHVSDIIIPVEEETTKSVHIALNATEATETETIEPFDEDNVTVIETPTEAPTEPETEPETTAATKAVNISASDEAMLLRVAMAEAEDQDVKGMALVMRVVLNRVASKAWPNSIEGVIYQKGQFEVISNGRYNRVTPDSRCYEALSWVESGWDESMGAEYFCMAGESKWHETHLTRLFQYKSHVFYK